MVATACPGRRAMHGVRPARLAYAHLPIFAVQSPSPLGSDARLQSQSESQLPSLHRSSSEIGSHHAGSAATATGYCPHAQPEPIAVTKRRDAYAESLHGRFVRQLVWTALAEAGMLVVGGASASLCSGPTPVPVNRLEHMGRLFAPNWNGPTLHLQLASCGHQAPPRDQTPSASLAAASQYRMNS
jgi:hypothetical protein